MAGGCTPVIRGVPRASQHQLQGRSQSQAVPEPHTGLHCGVVLEPPQARGWTDGCTSAFFGKGAICTLGTCP